MSTIRRILFGCVVSLLGVALASDATPAGKGALLAVAFLLGWVEWRAWKKAEPGAPAERP